MALELVLEAAAHKGQAAGAECVSMEDHLEKGQQALLNEGDENEMVSFQPQPVQCSLSSRSPLPQLRTRACVNSLTYFIHCA